MAENIVAPIVLGATLTSVSMSKSSANTPASYTLTVVEEPGQRFRLQRASDGLFANVFFKIGSLTIDAEVTGWTQIIKDISGTKKYSVTLQERSFESPEASEANTLFDRFNYSASRILRLYDDKELIRVEVGQSAIRPDPDSPKRLKSVYRITAVGLPRIDMRSVFGFIQAPASITTTIDTTNGIQTTYSAVNELKIARVASDDELNLRLGGIEGFIIEEPTGGLGVITSKSAGPFYNINRINERTVQPSFAENNISFNASWQDVRNLAEPLNSPGLIPIGTQVTVSIYKTSEFAFGIPFIEITPQVFAPEATI